MSTTLNYGQLKAAQKAEWLNSFITLPIFSYSGLVWSGASIVITQFNFTATKNFTIKQLPEIPLNVNFCLVIRYRISGVTHRYKLWGGVGETLAEDLYNGQVIKKNFVLEIWSTQQSTEVSLDEAINIKLSIRKIPITYASLADYENNVYVDEVGPTGQTLVPTTSFVPPLGLLAQYISDEYSAITGIANKLGTGFNMSTINGAPVFPGAAAQNGYSPVLFSALNSIQGNSPFAAASASDKQMIVALIKQVAWSDPDSLFGVGGGGGGTVELRQRTLTPQLKALNGVTYSAAGIATVPLNEYQVVNLQWTGNLGVTSRVGAGLGSFEDVSSVVGATFTQGSGMFLGGAAILLLEALCYNFSDATQQTIDDAVAYLLYKYGLGPGSGNLVPVGDVAFLDN